MESIENQLREALRKIMEAHRFNVASMPVTEIHAICFDALKAQPSGPAVCWVNDQQLLLCRKSPRDDGISGQPRNIAGSALPTEYCNTPLYASAALSAPSHGEQVCGWITTTKRLPIEWEDPDGSVEVQVSDGKETGTAVFFKKSGAMGWKRLEFSNVKFWQPLAAVPKEQGQ